ncbi:MAG TPA: C69 family dipeptidase, partial [Candidatus Krumholzibacterium sp.]|nr:C69 family dipeptidase [Candidatus Krumholzibacterium sp.]
MDRHSGIMIVLLAALAFTASSPGLDACTIVVAGKDATVDGSVITSHTDACDNSKLICVPARKYKKGSMADVYWGFQDPAIAHGEWEVIGQIPQVERTFAYFHSGYSHINEYQLAIGESTTSQREELGLDRGEGEQMITIEQAMAFALQRCRKAAEAVRLITSLVEEYGFLPSCGPESETLAIADPGEAWILEVYSVGKGWTRESGRPGALWIAKRVPDDHVAMIPNWSIMQQVDISGYDLSTPEGSGPERSWEDGFMVSENFLRIAVEHGWYDSDGGKDFVWQDVFAPIPREWA